MQTSVGGPMPRRCIATLGTEPAFGTVVVAQGFVA
jgi:hypothetical protein